MRRSAPGGAGRPGRCAGPARFLRGRCRAGRAGQGLPGGASRRARPRDAGEVARRIMAYQAGVQERLKAAELARVEAQARAEEAQARASLERSRRHRTIALAAVALSLVMLGGGGWTYLAWQRSERGARVDRAASGVELLYAAAQRTGDDLTRWAAARGGSRPRRIVGRRSRQSNPEPINHPDPGRGPRRRGSRVRPEATGRPGGHPQPRVTTWRPRRLRSVTTTRSARREWISKPYRRPR